MKGSKLLIWATLLFVASINFGVAADEGSWTGWIADENCAKDYQKSATQDHAACATRCLARGLKLALSTKEGPFLLDLDTALVDEHLGHEIVVTGELDSLTNTIKVSSVSMSDTH
ncbi:hypothetical protein MYX82_13740 [Acidobacteria bacterium AH-259-D05]|nr:hypothetical protein [Acidobacteria bacterium AH-259-D05]